jgi:hypothetical protein
MATQAPPPSKYGEPLTVISIGANRWFVIGLGCALFNGTLNGSIGNQAVVILFRCAQEAWKVEKTYTVQDCLQKVNIRMA